MIFSETDITIRSSATMDKIAIALLQIDDWIGPQGVPGSLPPSGTGASWWPSAT